LNLDKSRFMLFGIVAALLVLTLSLVIPPFQFPDEPHHFAAVMIEAWGEGKRDMVESETIRLMDRYDWWRLVGMGRPAVLPEHISEIRFLMADSAASDFRDRIQGYVVYHKVVGRLLRVLGAASIAVNYFFARFISGAFFLIAIVFLLLSMKRLALTWNADLKWATLLAVLIPQLSFIAVGVAPDAFVLLLGAMFFRASIELISGSGGIGHAGIIMLAAGLGLLTDRSSMIFAGLAILLPVFIARRSNLQKIIPATLLCLVVSILLLYFLFLRFPVQIETKFLWAKSILRQAGGAIGQLLAFDAFGQKFWLQFVDTSFLRFGWMHFGPPRVVSWLWRLAWLGGICGVLLVLFDGSQRRIQKRETAADITRRRLIQFSIFAIFLQLFALWTYYGFAHIRPQGRYLFPLLIPFAALLASGLRRLGDIAKARLGRPLLLTFMIFEIFVWGYALWAIVVPVFRLTIRGPFPGI